MAPLRFRGDRRNVLLLVGLLIGIIALADWQINREVPVGFLYLLPIVLASRVLTRTQTILLGIACTFLAETFDGYQWTLLSGAPRDLLYLTAFNGVGLFAYQIGAGRRAAVAHVEELESEIRARRDLEEQLQVLVDSSPIAILTMDEQGSVLLANDAAHRLFDLESGSLIGRTVRPYMPSLVNIPDLRTGQQSFRTVMQCKGRRHNGEIFIADVWFSTYRTSAGPRLAALVADTSEELRDREEAGLHQLLTGSRILIGAVSHEIRNICGAIAVVHENLLRSGILKQNQDFEALGTLVVALERIAAVELRQTADQAASVDLMAFLDELRIVISPSLRESNIEAEWVIPSHLPAVWADPHSLMQVFLNLAKNAERALVDQLNARICVRTVVEPQRISITVSDNGAGVSNPELLFRPFQEKATAAGMGLYLSRALMRSFGGDLRYTPDGGGTSFTVEIASIEDINEGIHGREDQAAAR